MSQEGPERPIGFWIKRVDELLSQRMGEALASQALTRGWIGRDGRRIIETESGRDAHAQLAATVRGFRREAAEGIDQEAYAVAVDVLKRMAANLSTAESDTTTADRRRHSRDRQALVSKPDFNGP